MLLQRKNYLLRNYRTSDFDNLLKLYREAEISDPGGAYPAPAELQERLERPRFNAQEDLFVAEERGKIVAFIEMAREKDIKRLILSCLVHPLHRGTGLASMLSDAVFNRAKDLEVQHIHVQVARDNQAAQKMLRRLGFYHVRTFLELRAKANWILSAYPAGMGEGYYLRNLQHGEEELLAHLQNSCFTGSWGFNPNTPEDIYYATSLQNSSLHDVVAIFREKEAVAYCWVMAEPEGARGKIHMLGVLPGHRGKGIASRVLRAGVSLLSQRGKKVVELTSDGNNVPARRLYFSVGFRTWSETLWYEISLSPE